jgi:hypothetical protein
MAAAPAEFFRWSSAEELQAGTVEEPVREVLLLYARRGGNEPELGFYRTATGWANVNVKCCHWPD